LNGQLNGLLAITIDRKIRVAEDHVMEGLQRGLLAMATLVFAGLAWAMPAAADPLEDFYKGRELTILIGHPPGGSYDLYAQLAASHLSRFIPGHPIVIVQSMPGSAGAKATASFYNRAPHDGSMIALFPETIAYIQLMDPAQGKWDVTKMNYIGSFAPVNVAFLVHKGSRIREAHDLFTGKTKVGCSGRASQSFQYSAVLKALTDMPLDIICGYDGSSAYTLALMRGEVDMVSKAWNATRIEDKEALDNGTVFPILQGGLRREAELPNVPLMQEITDDPHAKKALTFLSSGAAIGRALLAPQDVPADRLAALRAAFDKVVVDPDFLAAAKKRAIYVNPTPGVEVQGVSDSIVHTPKDVVELTSKAFDSF
jgi:tripartite-type tricarboxylate transporter receptor subunit TctC